MPNQHRMHSPTGTEYLDTHEPAARFLFEGVRRFIELSQAIDMRDVGRRSVSPDTQDGAAADYRRFQTYQTALAVLCGSILQLADIGLYLCSKNRRIPDSCREFATDDTAKYCVGRDIHGLPLGVYVHAGRNQFAHWGDERTLDGAQSWPAGFNTFTQAVFDRLLKVHYGHFFLDLVYNLGNDWYGGTPNRAADIVFPILHWYDYATYDADMRSMIAVPAAEEGRGA